MSLDKRVQKRKNIFNFIYSHLEGVGIDRNEFAEVICSEYKDLSVAKCSIRNMKIGKSIITERCYELLNIYLKRVKKSPIPLTYHQLKMKFNNIPNNGKNRTEHIGVRVSKRDFRTIKNYCEKTGITISSFIDNLIQNWKETN